MQAVGFDHWGAAENLKMLSVPVPKVAKPLDLLVKVYSFGLNPIDYKMRRDIFTGSKPNTPVPPERSPMIVGYDAAGIVTAVGSAVTKFKVGDAVYFAGDFTRAGSYAEYVLVDERIVALKPLSLGWDEAATVPLVALTSYETFHEQMHIELPNTLEALSRNMSKTMLIVAGAGGVGSFASQLAKHVFKIGTVISTASRPESIQFCKSRGADLTVSHASALAPQLAALGVKGVDYVFNCADTADADELIALLKPFGAYCTIVGFPKNPNMASVYMNRLTITAEVMFTRSMTNVEPERQGAILKHVAALLDTHVLKNTCTKVYKFSQESVIEATKLQESGHHMGKIAVTVVKP